MTSEIVRFMNQYISSESKRFKSYQIESKEINDLKRQRLNQPIYETHGDMIKDTWESSYD
jgi:hypothetical protein